MYTKVNDISEIDLGKYGSFRLCYIDDVEQQIYNPDYDPDDFRSYRTSCWIPNPEYIEGKKEKWAFFTPMFERQWGDDWNDAPYEHNAGYPYDDYRDESGNNVDYEILMVPFGYSDSNIWIKFPNDYGCGNSPFAVEDINHGAVAWMYGVNFISRGHKEYFSVQGGATLVEFLKELEKINKKGA